MNQTYTISFTTEDYDAVSAVLTEYEDGQATAEELYAALVEVHRAMAEIIN